MEGKRLLEWTLLLCMLEAITADHNTECQLPCPACADEVRCQEGVPLVLDGCRCCPLCARQHGQRCSSVNICDVTKQLVCDVTGTCRGSNFRGCRVNGTTYEDGQAFFTDCRTHCTCQDGSYACTSLCPHEMIRPSRRCRNPGLVEVRGQCCRQWTCADDTPASPPPCEPLTSDWSPCSATCGGGVSTRITNQNKDCTLLKETRLCQIRECPSPGDTSWTQTLFQMMRRDNKVCHPTLRPPAGVHLHWSNCTSVHRYRPRFCTDCRRRCCHPVATFTRSLPFVCDLDRPAGSHGHLWRLADSSASHPVLGTRTVAVSQNVMWVKRCVCGACGAEQNEPSEGDHQTRGSRAEDRVSTGRWEATKSQQLMGGDIDGDELL